MGSVFLDLSVPNQTQTFSSKPKIMFFCILGFFFVVAVVVMFCEIIFARYGYKLLLSHVTPGSSEGAVWKMHPFWDGMLLPGSLI